MDLCRGEKGAEKGICFELILESGQLVPALQLGSLLATVDNIGHLVDNRQHLTSITCYGIDAIPPPSW